jgi:hypothetical protein
MASIQLFVNTDLTRVKIGFTRGRQQRRTKMSFRIVNTEFAIEGPNGVRYVHDGARPFAVLFMSNRGEICALRCATQSAAEAAVAKFTAARERHAARAAQWNWRTQAVA